MTMQRTLRIYADAARALNNYFRMHRLNIRARHEPGMPEIKIVIGKITILRVGIGLKRWRVPCHHVLPIRPGETGEMRAFNELFYGTIDRVFEILDGTPFLDRMGRVWDTEKAAEDKQNDERDAKTPARDTEPA